MVRKGTKKEGQNTYGHLDERSQEVLESVICCYIATAEPVGSRTLSRKYGFGLSPATIRNIMADLEELGYLQHPYTSAGRVPTELGYRFYVNLLCHQLSRGQSRLLDKIRVLEEIAGRGTVGVEHLLRRVSHMLSSTSHYIGVVLAPRFLDTTFRRIEFVRLRENQVLVLLISNSGLTQQKVIQLEDNYSQEQLSQMANYLNAHLQNLPLSKVRTRLLKLMAEEKSLYQTLLRQALKVGQVLLELPESREVYIDGQLNILDEPEFADIEKMKTILHAFEEKSRLVGILDKCLEDKGMYILIGSETQMNEMHDCSLIAAPYKAMNMGVGVLGIIGPTRMEYSAVIPLVEYIARLTSQALQKD